MRLLCTIVLALAPWLAWSGCQTAKNSRPEPDPEPERIEWPYWPTSMRIHPLTRLTTERGEVVVEARIEFADQDGIASRGVGRFYLSLLDGRELGVEPLHKWEIDLSSTEANASHFDVVTRTYLIKLRLELDCLPDRGVLQAVFLSADGGQFRDRRAVWE